MGNLEANFEQADKAIIAAQLRVNRTPGSVALLAVSKRQPIEAIERLAELGQTAFGENYLQEAIPKIRALSHRHLEWHFIGAIQSNKTFEIARHFAWVHTIDRVKIARRLSAQRSPEQPPLNVCVQVNISHEASKGGIELAALPEFLDSISTLPNLRLRGLMSLPAPSPDYEAQRAAFRRLAAALPPALDTLSIGTSGDYLAAIAEGATIIRLGTALFGPRPLSD